MTLREVARRTGVSFVRIKQIEKAALAKIKKMSIFND
jgi:DNA-directed RNA polymerase sigma subunit (sigma70/sigma32)